MATKSVEDLIEEGARLLRAYVKSPRTDLLKQLAPIMVALRGSFTLEDGRPDWGGRSHDYRQAVAAMYRRARVPRDQLDTVQTALRYHVGNLLRERARAEELEAVGLTPLSPKDRLVQQRALVAAIADATRSRRGTRRRLDPLRVLTHVQALLEALRPADLVRLADTEAVALRAALRAVNTEVDRLIHGLDEVHPPLDEGRGIRLAPA